MKDTKYKFLEHTADMKFQAFGKTLEECFENAGYALRSIISKDKIKPVIKKKIKANGGDLENLLYNFLEEFLFLLDTEGFLVSKIIKIKIIVKKNKHRENYEINAEIFGDNIKKYKTITDVKAITYNDMWIASPSKDGSTKFACQVVVDV